jgi:hypothetical protein
MIGKHIYDASLQMFIQQPCTVDLQRLRFLRWLAERGLLEHRPVGPIDGAFARLDDSPPNARYPLVA